MKKALALFLCILLLTGCSQTPALSDETESADNQVLVLCADDAHLSVPLGARTAAQTAAPASSLVTPAAFIPDDLFILSSGSTLKIKLIQNFTENDVRTAADSIPANAFDGYRQTSVFYDEAQRSRLLELLTDQYGSEAPALQAEKRIVLQSEMIPDASAQIDALCAPGQDTASLDADLLRQITNYFCLKLRDYNDTYRGLGTTLSSSDRVKAEWFQWTDALAAQETVMAADFTRAESNVAIRSVTETDDYLIIGMQEQLRINYQYANGSHADRMAFSINHVLILQASDKGYQVVRDFYSCPILSLDTSEGIDQFLPAEAETLIWLMSYDEESGEWRPSGYVWEK